MELATQRHPRESERVPLDALIELRAEASDAILEADGIDVAPGGLAARAPFLPPVGARMECRFGCPPTGELVRADAEVVWSHWEGPHSAAFGMRFTALDTRGATAIRRMTEPYGPHVAQSPETAAAPAEPPVATLRIDGLGAPIEADLRADHPDRLILEQELRFLRLGKGVEVEVPGRGVRRGRIAAVEMRHTAEDVPSLTFGVLLDGASGEVPLGTTQAAPGASPAADDAPEPSAAGVPSAPEVAAPAPGSAGPQHAAAVTSEPPVDGGFAPRASAEPDGASWQAPFASAPGDGQGAPEVQPEENELPGAGDTWPDPETVRAAAAQAESAADTVVVRDASTAHPGPDGRSDANGADRDGVEAPESRARPATAEATPAPQNPGAMVWRGLVMWWAATRERLSPWWQRLKAWLDAQLTTWRERYAPSVRGRVAALYERFREASGTRLRALGRMKRGRAGAKRRTTAPAPRQSNVGGRQGTAASAPRRRSRPRAKLWTVGLLAFAGVGLGVYALGPRPDAEPIPLHRRVESGKAASQAAPAPTRGEARRQPAASAPPAATQGERGAPEGAETQESTQFGADDVPKGRTYVLRMNGPIETVEGDARDGGFVVRVPGRLSLDRASAIATSHGAVARAMILNLGDHAELTVEFVEGQKPAYQVRADGSSLEVTLERL